MKSFLLATLFFLLTIPCVHAQNGLAKAPSTGQTSIRSVVAQGGELRVLLHVAEAGTYQINICSIDGNIVYQQTLQVETGEVEQTISFAARAHGVYELNLVGNGVQGSRKVIW